MKVFVRLSFFIHNMGDHSMLTNSFTIQLSLFCFLENLDPQCGTNLLNSYQENANESRDYESGTAAIKDKEPVTFFFPCLFPFFPITFLHHIGQWVQSCRLIKLITVSYFFFLVSFPSFPLLFFTILDSERQNFFPCLFPFFPIAFLLHIGQ